MSETVIIPVDKEDNESNAGFGKYQFISELGDGAMGTVYKCFDPDFHRMVAVKTVHKDLLADGASGEFRERFRNEMRAAGKLTHPNIVSVFDAGEKDNCPFYVMEFVEGRDLKHVLDANEPVELERALSIIKGVLRGLSSIHKNGITHRDLKPANIFVSNDGVAKIADFGIAKLDSSDMTQIGTVIGSPKYMSPEQCIGEPVDARTDLFATGIILYELLTGSYCFNGTTTSAITQKIMNVDIVPPSQLDDRIPRYLDKVLMKALSKNADDRFQNAQDFLDALDEKNHPKDSASGKYKLAAFGAITATLITAVLVWLDLSSEPAVSTPVEISEPLVIGDQPTVEPPAKPTAEQAVGASDVKTSVETLSPEKAAKIAKLFKVAETYQRIGRLVSPAGSNAFDAYKIILSIDPGNTRAGSGLISVQEALIGKAKQFLAAGDTEQAVLAVQAGQEVFPDEIAFVNLLKQIKGSTN